MKSIQKINVDISRDRNLSEPSVYAKQNDSNSREVEVTLYDNGVQLSSLTTTGKVFFGKGANAYGEAIEISNGVTEFTIPQNALSSPGRIQAEILILNADDDTETLTSASFVINCRTQINPSGSIDGENNGDYIERIVDDLQSQIDALGGADVSEFQSDIENLQSQINRLDSNTLDAVKRLSADDDKLQAQIDNKSDATNLVNGPAEGSLRSICSHGKDYIGDWAVTLGYGTFATGVASHAEGFYNSASGEHSHAEGQHNIANGENSHAEGSDTIAIGPCQHVQGRYNIEDKSERYAHIVGNGHDDLLGGRSNAHTLDWNGNAWFAGDVLVGGVSQDDANAISLVNISTKHKTDIESLKAKDTDLQSQIDTKVTRKVAILGSDTANSAGWYKVASGTMTKWTSLSLLFAVHTPATSGKHSGILQLDLRGGTEAIEIGDTLKLGWLVRAGFDLSQVIVVVDGYDWELYYKVQSPIFFRAFFEGIQESNDVSINKAVYTLYTDSVVETTAPVATATSTDLGTVNEANKLTTARNINGIAFDGSADINITANDITSTSGQTVYQTIVDLTARIEALEENSSGGSGGVSQAVLIDWDVNTNGTTQGTVVKDANGLHASGNTSLRIANYWRCDASAYDGITFTAYGSGKLRVEVGGVEGEYKVLGTTPTTYTVAFADIGLTELSSIEINLQTQGAYDLTVSDIYGYTNL